jgi:exopolysaccharide biosynthesis predicted pyruvyltransferase EpsI
MAILHQTIDILNKCTMVVTRDPDSYDYLNQFNHNINIKYIPDALYSWTQYQNYFSIIHEYSKALIPFPEYDKYWNKFDFSQPYICVSGSSSAAWKRDEAYSGYTALIQILKKQRYNLFLVPTCLGDNFLYKVAEQTNTPIIPVNTNILGGMSILANATVFVSGRWHPSILASLGGTPCVIFGSNSSKTKSFLRMMDYEKQTEYNAIPKEEEFKDIITDIENYIQQGENLRTKIKNKATELSELTNLYQTIL